MRYRYLESLEKFGIDLGLDRINELLCRLNAPQRAFRSIHVAGTNGKGSTCAMIAAILKEAGYKVGLYTSPHLFKSNERIKINGKDISDNELSEALRTVKRTADSLKIKPTVFEALTAAACWHFARKKVDYAVVEVGMGGRLDATNVIRPLVSVITNIDLEHTKVLGRTLGRIAYEKAGIIKPGIPVVTAETKVEPLRVMKEVAKKNGSSLIAVNRKPCLPAGRQSAVSSSLIGTHQKINAACAIAAIRLAGIKVSRPQIARGLKKVVWPARFQVIRRDPITIVDGAHNPSGVKVLLAALKKYYPRDRFTFIVGVQRDKDASAMLRQIKKVARKILLTHSSHKQAASLPGEIGLKLALCKTAGEDRVIAGSLFLAADALKYLDATTAYDVN